MQKLERPCRLWAGAKNNKGYGQVRAEGKLRLAHRVSYCQANNLSLDDIEGVIIRHKCDTPACHEPTHLEPGTYSDNMQDCVERGRHTCPRGEAHRDFTITDDQLKAARAEYVPHSRKHGIRSIARRLGVSHQGLAEAMNNKDRAV